jgi:hypothetical protein
MHRKCAGSRRILPYIFLLSNTSNEIFDWLVGGLISNRSEFDIFNGIFGGITWINSISLVALAALVVFVVPLVLAVLVPGPLFRPPEPIGSDIPGLTWDKPVQYLTNVLENTLRLFHVVCHVHIMKELRCWMMMKKNDENWPMNLFILLNLWLFIHKKVMYIQHRKRKLFWFFQFVQSFWTLYVLFDWSVYCSRSILLKKFD